MDLDENETRLIKAWRRSGYTLGRMLAYAAQDAHVLPGDFLDRMSDETLAVMLEAAARVHGQGSEKA